MENYTRGEVKELDEKLPFSDDLSAGTTVMRIKPGTKLFNITGYADKQFAVENVRRIIFAGVGQACLKTVSCVEVFKRSHHNTLHQLTKLSHVRIEEYWNPIDSSLERLKVNRDIPAIYVLLSKDPLDASEPGYQPPDGSFQWDAPTATNGRSGEKQRTMADGGARKQQKSRQRRPNNGEPNRWKRPEKRGSRGGAVGSHADAAGPSVR